ncbi:hypothetical protein BvRS1_53950 [Burkholderia vietnamiensis]|nr:hypothetical protein BvRS1_53950 [Burkholderia vietnamiensis]
MPVSDRIARPLYYTPLQANAFMSQTTAPFLPFTRPEIDEETIQGVVEVLRSGWITTGPQNQKFEAALSEYCGGRPVRAFNSGTCPLEIGLRIAGVGPGDEGITRPPRGCRPAT